MIAHQSEAIVLRTWPFREADQIVSLFTREQGRIAGIAKFAARSRRRFGGALEPTTFVRARYCERPKRDLVRLDAFEVIRSPLSEPVDYARAAALSFFVEVLQEALPEHDPQDRVFRLMLAVTEETRAGRIWMPVTYFALWITRLMGWLPDLGRCTRCGAPLAGADVYYSPGYEGILCAADGRGSFVEGGVLSAGSHELASHMLRSPVSAFAERPWPRECAADLRWFAIRGLERRLERPLATAAALRSFGG